MRKVPSRERTDSAWGGWNTRGGGTLFLDEIGELSLALQVKLLRFLQEHVIERVGGRESIAVDVRIVAATNKDIYEAIKKGEFREDLYYRLGVITLNVPLLKDRGDDIFLLAKTFLHRYSSEFNKKISGFHMDAIQFLSEYSWPGNVRELENRIKRAVVMSEGEWITPYDLNFTPVPASPPPKPSGRLREAREALEKQMIHQALERNKGIILRAAEELGISRQSLSQLIKKFGISVKEKEN